VKQCSIVEEIKSNTGKSSESLFSKPPISNHYCKRRHSPHLQQPSHPAAYTSSVPYWPENTSFVMTINAFLAA